jgi:hypothetical protein
MQLTNYVFLARSRLFALGGKLQFQLGKIPKSNLGRSRLAATKETILKKELQKEFIPATSATPRIRFLFDAHLKFSTKKKLPQRYE